MSSTQAASAGAPPALPPTLPAELEFEPVPRKVKRPDGWTPELQREFIARLAQCGSPRDVCAAMDKNLSGVESVYKSAGAESFRAAWDRAVETGRRARLAGLGARFDGPVPGTPRGRAADPGADADDGGEEWDGDGEADEEELGATIEMIANIGVRFLRKVAAEREARLGGQVVTADFYLRQITVLEVMFDMLASGKRIGGPWEMLHELRRGGQSIYHIVDTPFVRQLDARRRELWESNGEPPRPPETFAEEFIRDHGDHRTPIYQHYYGGTTDPARGHSKAEWAAMDFDQQKAARQRQFDEDAQKQVEWEASARRDFENRRGSAT